MSTMMGERSIRKPPPPTGGIGWRSVHVASAPELAEVSGGYFARCKPARPSRAAQDRGAALRLWEISEQLTATTASPA